MEDKELIKKVKNSFKAKKSIPEILGRFQKRGYKLAYANKLISKAKRPKKIVVITLSSILIIFLLALTSYSLFFNSTQSNLSNPLSFITGNAVANPSATPISIDEIQITPEFISYLLQEIGVNKLHKNPLTFEKPIINFEIEGATFYSEIGKEIETKGGLNDKADLQFNTNKRDLIEALMSQNPDAVFKNSVETGRTQIQVFAGKPELLSKGYLKLYDSLK